MVKKQAFWGRIFSILPISLLVILSGCSQQKNISASGASTQYSPTKTDPLKSYNRRIYNFNVGLDHLIVRPAAQAYKAVTPEFVDLSIGNFFSNLGDVGNAFNNLLQFKITDAINDTERFLVNSTIGLVGLLDVASEAGLTKHDEDFGQTLAKWGVKSGPYIMLPFLGPSTVRDGISKLSVDRLTDPTNYSDDSLTYLALEIFKKRSDLFSREAAFAGISNDEYTALRDAWLHRREYQIRDGKIDKQEQSDLIDELESLDAE